jgi:hypothetical protein
MQRVWDELLEGLIGEMQEVIVEVCLRKTSATFN